MAVVLSQEELQEVFDQVTRDVTEKVAGIRLYEGEAFHGNDFCTVYSTCEGGVHSSLSLCMESSVFTRLARHIMQEEHVTSQDVEDFAKQYFNVLCGNIAAKMFRMTKVASRFGIPVFCRGQYQPEGCKNQFVLSYFSDQNEGVRLTHHTFLTE